jgi:predicted HicB family RNase H-like nuclease
MDLQKRKIEFVQKFLKLQSEEVIAKLEKILRKENKNADQEDFKTMSIGEFNARIDKSMDDSKNGRLIKASELKAKMEKWS